MHFYTAPWLLQADTGAADNGAGHAAAAADAIGPQEEPAAAGAAEQQPGHAIEQSPPEAAAQPPASPAPRGQLGSTAALEDDDAAAGEDDGTAGNIGTFVLDDPPSPADGIASPLCDATELDEPGATKRKKRKGRDGASDAAAKDGAGRKHSKRRKKA